MRRIVTRPAQGDRGEPRSHHAEVVGSYCPSGHSAAR
jgi:hypothetical protein